MPRTTIRSEDITDSQVGTAEIATDAVDTAEIAAGAVENAQVAAAAVVAVSKLETGTRGDTLFWNSATQASRLAAGTSGQFLKTQGTGADPVWASAGSLLADCNFRARITSDQSNVTGNGTSYNMTGAIWTEDWDIGSDFSNGTFTAPANGYYLLGFSAYLNQTNGVTDMTFNIVTPAGTHIMSRGNWSYGTGGTGYASPSSARSGITQSGVFYIANAGTAHCNLQGYNAGSDTVDVTAFSTFFWGMRVM